ncbi:MAG: TetR/AcrR family transcriptional regulator [Thermocrispum sp.]
MTIRSYHHGDLRAALLDRAQVMLRERGADALSLRELARDLRVSHAAPSRHFKDKRALLDALAAAGFERLGSDLDRAAATQGGFDAKLRAVAMAYVAFAVRDAALLDVMYAGKHEPDVSDDLRAAAEKVGVSTLGLIADGQRSGQVRPGDPQRLGLLMLSAIHGFASLRASGMLPPDDVDVALYGVVDDLVRAVRP